jgi:hypothetical protein
MGSGQEEQEDGAGGLASFADLSHNQSVHSLIGRDGPRANQWRDAFYPT